jgi:hypothetical protein
MLATRALSVLLRLLKALNMTLASDLSINCSSTKCEREMYRAVMTAALPEDLSDDVPLVIYWDGKLIEPLWGKDNVDRFRIVVTGFGICQLLKLKVSKVVGATEKNQASAVVQALEAWNVEDCVVGMCADTTSSNTDITIGACIDIGRKLGKDFVYFACRHRVMYS